MKPIPFLCGLFACTSLTLAWVLYVNHLVNTATVPGDKWHWSERACHEAYGICYNGCNDCIDVSKIEDACAITAAAQSACDARRMWFWADRYPTDCLQAVGSLLEEKDLKRKRFKLRFLYILGLFTAAAGYAAYGAADRFVEWRKRQERRARYWLRDDSGTSQSAPLLRATTISTALISTLLYASAVEAYACTDWHAVHNQPFVSVTDPTLFGNIHGWLSDCYTESYPCGETCDSDKKGSTTCTTAWCNRERPDASPADFVRAAAKMVGTRCGFEMVDVVPGIVDKRIANPRIEGSLWVKISVNRFNGSDGLDGQVLCLSDVVEWPSLVTARDSGIWSRFRLGF
ncbi:hypothetical protein CONLIGDRAFT_627727 [Coniochaeta ligniaria NRRL 30616]|uniref:Uncharacterized protein n=1 Tax=Coniochaeta ligniaria NRRL 30616 TaxID=1408157 RepID=A0A1J7J8J8_9PEZI|nr:hypothetical protein CONLIGDRAFT_627727 [Coniochaeta ligniaria NRRL 30616]